MNRREAGYVSDVVVETFFINSLSVKLKCYSILEHLIHLFLVEKIHLSSIQCYLKR